MKTPLVPIILSGGSGTRLWPLSTEAVPKQFLTLIGESSLFSQTLDRLNSPVFSQPIVICNQRHEDLVRRELDDTPTWNAPYSQMIVEPIRRNTAPAIAIAALDVVNQAPDAIAFVAPSDHMVQDVEEFRHVAAVAAEAARDGAMVVFGMTASRPESGFGHIRRGAAIDSDRNVFAVDAFVEKPDPETAKAYYESGEFTWNSGMFVFRLQSFLDELERQRPDMMEACRKAWAQSKRTRNTLHLDPTLFADIEGDSIDYAVMEGCRTALVIEASFGWSDIGSWHALWEVLEENGNATRGNTALDQTNGSLVFAEEGKDVAVVGAQNLVVVVQGDRVLVVDREKCQEIKAVVSLLEGS